MLRYTEVIDDNWSSRIKRNACSDKNNLKDTGIFFTYFFQIIILSLVNT
jgi:transposase-like protein